jgi:hypothetical protein
LITIGESVENPNAAYNAGYNAGYNRLREGDTFMMA